MNGHLLLFAHWVSMIGFMAIRDNGIAVYSDAYRKDLMEVLGIRLIIRRQLYSLALQLGVRLQKVVDDAHGISAKEGCKDISSYTGYLWGLVARMRDSTACSADAQPFALLVKVRSG